MGFEIGEVDKVERYGLTIGDLWREFKRTYGNQIFICYKIKSKEISCLDC